MAIVSAQPHDPTLLQRMSWGALLTIVTVVGTLSLACATPFAGLAALAALFLPRRDAFVLIGVNWLANQVIGFGFMQYPWTWATLLAGIELGVVAIACTGAAMLAFEPLRRAGSTVAVLGTFAAAFIVYEGLNFVTSIGHHDGDFQVSIVLYVLYLNGLAFAGLLLLQSIASAIGLAAPRALRSTGARASAAS